MGQKVHPNGIRLGIVKPWNATWFANTNEFADNLRRRLQGTSVPYQGTTKSIIISYRYRASS